MMDLHFDKVIEAVRMDTGIRLPESNYRTVRDFVRERCECLGASPEGYLDYARRDSDESERLLDAVTINETYFFREERQFRLLENRIFPDLRQSGIRNPLIWSASCATGEEAISLAVLAERFWGDDKDDGFTVWATDINPCALKIFKNGIYSDNAFRRDGNGYHHLLEPYLVELERGRRLDSRFKERFRIRKLNLFTDVFSELPRNFSIVFFRNTLIYMDLTARGKILEKIASVLAPGGFLFLSASEMPLLSHPNLHLMERDGVYFFRKTEESETASAGPVRRKSQNIAPGVPPASGKPEVSMSERKTARLDLREVLDFANQLTGNDRFSIPDTAGFSIARGLLDILSRINSNRTDQAALLLAEMEERLSPNEILCYLQGCLRKTCGDADGALRHFQKALAHHPGFWPARFYLASLLQPSSPHQARTEYRICQKDLEAYIDRKGVEYQFLLEEFSPRYFHGMCGKWIDRLSREFIDPSQSRRSCRTSTS